VRLLSQKKLVDNILESILNLFEVSEDLNKIVRLKLLYEGINLLNLYYFYRGEAQRMLAKYLGLSDHQLIQLAGGMHFMDIVKQTYHYTLLLK
jgi:hypothetical protein